MLILRLAVFPFFIAAVVHVMRRFVPGDRRMGVAAGWAVGTALIGAMTILVGSGMPQERAAVGVLVVKLAGLLPLAGALWIAVYCGMLLGDQRGGYWLKSGARIRDAVLYGGVAPFGLLLYSWIVCRFSAVPLVSVPVGSAILPALLKNLTFSLGEEFFYRGCLQALLVTWLVRWRGGSWWAVAIASVLFMAQHGEPLRQMIINLLIFPAGVVFGLLFARFGIVTAVAVHFVSNLLMVFVLPRLV